MSTNHFESGTATEPTLEDDSMPRQVQLAIQWNGIACPCCFKKSMAASQIAEAEWEKDKASKDEKDLTTIKEDTKTTLANMSTEVMTQLNPQDKNESLHVFNTWLTQFIMDNEIKYPIKYHFVCYMLETYVEWANDKHNGFTKDEVAVIDGLIRLNNSMSGRGDEDGFLTFLRY